MNFKRRKPKHQRSGCLLCKPHKDERVSKKLKLKGRKGMVRLRDISSE